MNNYHTKRLTTTHIRKDGASSPPRFILPEHTVIEDAAGGAKSYAIVNYYGNSPIAFLRCRRFQRALNLAALVPTRKVIDMGTADGVLLPTLAKYYQQIVAIDIREDFVDRSRKLVNALKLDNVELICNHNLSIKALRIGPGFKLMFLLETLEHVGSQPDMWGTKMSFLRDCFSLLDDDGRIVISVPKMVGLAMLIKRILQLVLGVGHDRMTFCQLMRSSLLKKTDELEPLWNGGHIGFNHLKLDACLEKEFVVHRRSESLISVFYLISPKI